jgi:tetratricopeptide (TPR) repeat protein
LRLYTEGTRFARAGERDSAVNRFRRAIAIDTGFASAYRSLGNIYADESEAGPAMEYFAHAIANGGRLPFYERYLTIASHAMNYLNDYPRAVAAYQHILERYPEDVVALNNLGYVYSAERKFAQQESLLVRAIHADSSINSVHLALAMAAVNNGDYGLAQRQIDWVAARDSNFHNIRLARIYVPASQQQWARAEAMARARIAATPASSPDLIDAFETLAGIVITRGRLAEGEQLSRNAIRLAQKFDDPGRVMTSALRIALLDLRLRHDTAGAIVEMERALVAYPRKKIPEGDRHYDDFARVFAAADRLRRARELVALAAQRAVDPVQKVNPDRHWALGTIALAEGRSADAIAELRVADSTHSCTICVLPDLARAYAAAGQRDSAIAVYERYLLLPWEWRFETDDTEMTPALTHLQRLYLERGDRARASLMDARLDALHHG